eukprot:scaffold5780_cov80-Skeletonema_menzelii.AAC.1
MMCRRHTIVSRGVFEFGDVAQRRQRRMAPQRRMARRLACLLWFREASGGQIGVPFGLLLELTPANNVVM